MIVVQNVNKGTSRQLKSQLSLPAVVKAVLGLVLSIYYGL